MYKTTQLELSSATVNKMIAALPNFGFLAEASVVDQIHLLSANQLAVLRSIDALGYVGQSIRVADDGEIEYRVYADSTHQNELASVGFGVEYIELHDGRLAASVRLPRTPKTTTHESQIYAYRAEPGDEIRCPNGSVFVVLSQSSEASLLLDSKTEQRIHVEHAALFGMHLAGAVGIRRYQYDPETESPE